MKSGLQESRNGRQVLKVTKMNLKTDKDIQARD